MADSFEMNVLKRLPLAEAILTLWGWICRNEALDEIWNRYRGSCYDKVITFPMIVRWVRDALLQPESSGNKSYHQATEQQILCGARSSYYDKLSRLPSAVSEAFLTQASRELQSIFPSRSTHPLPSSLERLRLYVLDGKAIKKVPKRLLPLRSQTGGILGGKGLVTLDLKTGLAVHLATHVDGETNDAKLFAGAWHQATQVVPDGTQILAILDRQFCDLTQPRRIVQSKHHFLVRYHPKTTFVVDSQRAMRQGVDEHHRVWKEEWGWLGSGKNARRLEVRRITLFRGEEEDVILVTDLSDPEQYPATDLLRAYLSRWRIENVFQEITEVFSLNRLISSTPEGTLFQLSFSLVMYNLIQVVRGYVAEGQQCAAQAISSEKLYHEVVEELIGLNKLMGEDQIVELIRPVVSAEQMRQFLGEWLHSVWSNWWWKAKAKKKKPKAPKTTKRDHTSVFRVLDQHRKKQRSANTS